MKRRAANSLALREDDRTELARRNAAIVAALGQIVYEWRPRTGEVIWEGDYTHILGYSAEEIGNTTETWTQRIHPDDAAAALRELEAATCEHRLFDLEYRFRHRDGSWRWMHDCGVPEFDEQGRLERIIGVFVDVTARRQVEEDLRRQKAEVHAVNRLLLDSLLRNTAEQLAHGCLVVAEELTGSAFGFIGDLNAAGRCDLIACTVPGWDAARTPRGLTDSLIKDIPPRDPWGRILETGQALVVNEISVLENGLGLPAGHPPLTAFLGVPLKSGRLATGLIALANKPGGYDAADQRAVESLAVAFLELQRRKWIETALRQSEARNRALVKALPDLIFLTNRQGILVDYHAGEPELLYVPPEKFLDRPMREVLPPAVAAGLEAGAHRALETRTTQTFEYPLLIRGEELHFEARLAACGQDLVIFIVRNITERKRAELERRQLLRRIVDAQEEERRRLATELHDQLGQELAGLLLRIQAVESKSPRGSPVAEDLPRLHQMADGLIRRVHDLAWQLRPAILDDLGLPTALRRHVEDWSREHHVAVDFETGKLDPLPITPLAATALFRVAQEALANVARHAAADEVSLLLHRRQDELVLVIEDNGRGFDVDAVMRATESRVRLGLMGMQERMAAVGGVLDLESRPGNGTTVIARVPLDGAAVLESGWVWP